MEMIDLRLQLRNLAAGICAFGAIGCHTTKNVNLVENPDATSRPSRIEVITKGGSRIVVYQPVIQRDSLRGFSDQERTSPVTIAVSDVQSATSREVSGGRTALFVFGLIAAAVAAVFVVLIIALSQVDW